jgi:hypothetical protein
MTCVKYHLQNVDNYQKDSDRYQVNHGYEHLARHRHQCQLCHTDRDG